MAKNYDDEIDLEETGGFGRAAVAEAAKRPTYKQKQKAPSKPKERIVTKEELKKSGFTNLRDFLNAERGLTRRDGKAPSRATEAGASVGKTEKAPQVAEGRTATGMPREARGMMTPSQMAEVRAKEELNKYMSQSGKLGTMKKGGMVKKKTYKSGGMASSASKRADGCIMKGKTRGRIL